MKKLKKPLLFSLALLPVSLIAVYFVILYQFENYDEVTVQMIVSEIGSIELAIFLILVQGSMLIFITCFLGYILANKLGILKTFRLERKSLCITGILTIMIGIVFSLDYWTFGAMEPMIRDASAAGLTVNGVIASILYGGIVEEILLRLFMMSLVAWIIWKLFFRKQEVVPTGVLIAANIVAAFLFAAGHLPATITLFGELTPLLLFRCFLLNGGFGLAFGWLYYKHGIQYSMLAHAGIHIVSKLIWVLFI